MIKYINPQEVIKSKLFIREPVDFLSQQIIRSSSKKIILNGGRGSGKSIILYNTQDKGLGTENQTILVKFDSIISFNSNPNQFFDEAFFKHYYELVFSYKLLNYIRENYILIYESNFKDIETLLNNIANNTDDYINNRYFSEERIKRYLVPTEISAEILKRFRKCLNVNTLALAIDRFDWTNGSSSYVQQIISRYFELFDKSIITTDDLALNDEYRKKELYNKGYSFITTMYGKDIDIIKHIIIRRIELYKENTSNSSKKFDYNIMTDLIYGNLINKFDGNITSMLDTVKEIVCLFGWKDGNIENLEKEFNEQINIQLDKIRQLKKMDARPPKFHL